MILSRIFCAAIGFGVMWAGVVLGRIMAGQQITWVRRMRVLIVGLATYGSMTFLHAAIAGVSVHDALHPGGLLQALPFLLQGAFIGGFVILPLACIASIIRLGIPRFREQAQRPIWVEAVALTTCFALLITSLELRIGEKRFTPQERIALLDKSLRAIEDGEREMPRDRWDPDYVVSMVGHDPRALFEWVRDNTYWIPYRGELRGPIGVLMDRQGNSLDRALLLATLLQRDGQEVRLAHGHLAEEQAAKLLPALVNRRVQLPMPADIETSDANLQRIAAQFQLGSTIAENAVREQEQLLDAMYSELYARVADQSARLLAALERPGQRKLWMKRFEDAVESLRDHWWVQLDEAGSWVDLDTLDENSDTGKPATNAEETLGLENIPDDMHHQVEVRIISEQWANGTLSHERILQHVLRPSELYGQPIVLQFWPGAWPATVSPDPNSKYGLKGIALEQDNWIAALLVNENTVAHGLIRGNSNTSAGASNNPFSGMAGAFANTMQQDRSSAARPELTAVWIEYEIRAPGEAPRTIRRKIFDLLDSASHSASSVPRPVIDETKKLQRSLALMMRTEILPVTNEIAPEFVTHLAAETMSKNRELLQMAIRLFSAKSVPTDADIRKTVGNSTPPVSPLYTLAVMRTGWGQDDVVMDRLNILTRHQYPEFKSGRFGFRDDVDIVVNDVGVSLTEPDAFSVRVASGVLDTNAEALISAPAAVAENTGEAFKLSHDWMSLRPPQKDSVASLGLSEDVRSQLGDELAAGNTIVAPGRAVSIAGQPFVGWWRIDPEGGTTLGVNEKGWGDAGVDYGLILRSVATFWNTLIWEYTACQAISAAVPVLKYLATPRTSPTIGRLPDDMQNIVSNSISASNGQCVMGAIAAGALATLPIILLTMKYSRIPRRMVPIHRFAEEAEVVGAESRNVSKGYQETKQFERQLPHPDSPYTKSVERYRPQSKILVPKGSGPYEFSPETLKFMRENADHPLAQSLGKPEWYEQANAAAKGAYNQARAAGSADNAARQASFEAYKVYIKQARGNVRLEANPHGMGLPIERPLGVGSSTVALILSGALVAFIPETKFNSDQSKGTF